MKESIIKNRFSAAIGMENARGYAAVIPDIKRVSPKEGELFRGRDPVETAKSLARWGAPMLSVVTEPEQFGGSTELLKRIVKNTDVPVLRKDFITSEDELFKTVETGASAILLICAVMDEETLRALYRKSIELDLEPLVEVHTPEELKLAGKLGARLIGINNRNIITLEKDGGGPSRTAALASGLPRGALLISESGILTQADARLAVSAGANAILVGTSLWLAQDMETAYRSLHVERGEGPFVRL